jgi:hypothetical protein
MEREKMPKDKKLLSSAVPILTGTRDNTGIMRGRDVRALLGNKVDPDVRKVLEMLAEQTHTNVINLATTQDQMLNIIQKFADIAGNMKERTDQMSRAMQDELEGASSDAPNTEH